MIGIIVSTHGNLSYGLKDTYEMVAGEIPSNVIFTSLCRDSDVEKYKLEFNKIIESFHDYSKILVLVDLEGGSPFNVASEYYYNSEFKKEIEVITGVNFPLLVEAISNSDSKNLLNYVEELIEVATDSIKRVQHIKNDEEEDF